MREMNDRLLAQPGEKRTLGEIMVAKGYLSPEEVKAVLAQQSKAIMSCPACRLSFTVTRITKRKTTRCPRCKGPLRMGKPSESLRTDAELLSDSALLRRQKTAPEPVASQPSEAPQPVGPCKICDHPFVGPMGSDGRMECLSCHVRFVPE